MNNNSNAFGEVIESSLLNWGIQCWQLDSFPPLGALIQLEHDNNHYFGIVSSIYTGPQDTSRKPFAFGKTIEQLQREQPHIFQLLHTTLTCIPLGYKQAGKIFYEIPRKPAAIHTFAQVCSREESHQFFAHAEWLITFFALAQQSPIFDELLLAVLHNAHENGALSAKNIQEIIDIFSLLTHSDYRKLKIFLQRIEVFLYV